MDACPVLYSFRRCPYAMRARMALYKANIRYEHREVVLQDKPAAMLCLSKAGTVPVLLTPDKTVIEQSYEIMLWALNQFDPEHWLDVNTSKSRYLIEYNDNEFKYFLDRYKYHVAYPEYAPEYYRKNAELFLEIVEKKLSDNNGLALFGQQLSLVDIAIFPFVRQFARVDFDWFLTCPYKLLIDWLAKLEASHLFMDCMRKYKQWQPQHEPVYFPV